MWDRVRARCVRVLADLNRYVPTNDLGPLRWYAALKFSRDAVAGTVTVSQQAVAEATVVKFWIEQKYGHPYGDRGYVACF